MAGVRIPATIVLMLMFCVSSILSTATVDLYDDGLPDDVQVPAAAKGNHYVVHRVFPSLTRTQEALKRDEGRRRHISARIWKTSSASRSTSGSRRRHSNMSASSYMEAIDPVQAGLNLDGSGQYFARVSVGTSRRRQPSTVHVYNRRLGGATAPAEEPHRRQEMAAAAAGYYLALDTGSDLSWVQCQPCASCYDQLDKPIFDPSTSVTLRNVTCHSKACEDMPDNSCEMPGPDGHYHNEKTAPCGYMMQYGDGSQTTGNLFMDTITFPGYLEHSASATARASTVSSKHVRFKHVVLGCGHNNNGHFLGAAGVLGLGSGPLSLPRQVGNLTGHTFSYCLPTRPLPELLDDVGTHEHNIDRAGILSFGASPHHHLQTFRFTPLVHQDHNRGVIVPMPETYYYVSLSGISVDGVRVPIPESVFRFDTETGKGGVILDSGTVVTSLPRSAYQALRDAFVRAAARRGHLRQSGTTLAPLDTCFYAVAGGFHSDAVPDVVLHFNDGADLPLPPSNVLVSMSDWAPQDDPSSGNKKGQTCLAFRSPANEDNEDDDVGFTVLGNLQQQGFHFLFDRRRARLGFVADQQC